MAKNAPDLFHNRSTTQDFLFSRTDENRDPNAPTAGNRQTIGGDQVAGQPELLDRKGLESAIDKHMAELPALCLIAIQVQQPTGPNEQDASGREMPVEPVHALLALPSAAQGIWGRIKPDRFVLALPGLDEKQGLAVAETLLSEAGAISVTIGLAAYPTINYARRQTLANAEKALDHGVFFGPGTVTRFDAVSLNISGDRLYQAGNIGGAMEEFKKGLTIDPTSANLHNSLGVCHGVLKDYDNAIAAFDNAAWLAPEDVMAVYNKGYLLWLKGEREEALEKLLEANRLEADVFEVVYHIGKIYLEMDRPDDARPFLESATCVGDRSGAAFKSLGACLDQLGLTKEAIQAYKSSVKITPNDAQALSALGSLYTKRGESPDVALVLCHQSVSLDPDNGFFRFQLAEAFLSQGKLEDALAAFEAAEKYGHACQAEIEATQNRLLTDKAS